MYVAFILPAILGGVSVYLFYKWRDSERDAKIFFRAFCDLGAQQGNGKVFRRGRYVGTVDDLADFYLARERAMSGEKDVAN